MLAGLDPGLDEGTDSINVEEHYGGEDDTEKVEDVWRDLSTDVHPSGSGQVHEGSDIAVLAATPKRTLRQWVNSVREISPR